MLLKNKILFQALIPGMLTLAGCSNRSSVSSAKADYREDLASVRPRFEYVESKIPNPSDVKKNTPEPAPKAVNDQPLYINKRLETILDTLAQQNKSIRYISGFRIQIYVGNVRQEAEEAKSYIYQIFPDLNPYISYSQPTYRVKAGDFIYRSDAEQYLEQVREQYTSAVILPDRVEIKRSLMLSLPSDQN